MSEGAVLWFLIAIVGLGTFGLRFSFIAWLEKISEPDWFRTALRYIPAAVLSALVCSSLLIRDGQLAISTENHRLLAALLAGVVGYVTRSLLWTILTGLMALFALRHLLAAVA